MAVEQKRSPSWQLVHGYVLTGWAIGLLSAAASAFLTVYGGSRAFDAWLAMQVGGSLSAARVAGEALGIAAVFLLVTAISLYLGFKSTQAVRYRLAALADASAMFAAGKLGYRVTIECDDDIAWTGRQMNVMAQRLQDQVRALQETAADNLELRKKLELSATLRERERVRRELHDRVSQDLFGLSMLCETASVQRERSPDRALSLLPELAVLAKRTQLAMRGLLLELRPAELVNQPLADALLGLVRELSERASVPIALDAQNLGEDSADLSPGVEDGLFLIAQEALINALRHAQAQQIEVRLVVERDRAILAIRDDGVGLPGGKRLTSFGLRTMIERAELLGGSCSVRAAERGTEVIAIIPRVEAQKSQ